MKLMIVLKLHLALRVKMELFQMKNQKLNLLLQGHFY